MEEQTPYGKAAWLEKAIADLRKEISLEVDITNYPEIMEKINRLSILTATASQAMATAKEVLLQRQKELMKSLPNMQPSLQVKWLQAELFKEEGQLTYCDRLNASISNSIEGYRSILSFAKSEMEHLKHQS